MEPDLSRIRRKLTGRYVVISAFVLLVFGLAVFLEVSRARKALLREQVQQLASAAASQMPLILHEVEEYNLLPSQTAHLESGHVALLDAGSANLDQKRIVLLNKNRIMLSQFGTMPFDLQAVLPTSQFDQRQYLNLPSGIAYWRPVYLRETSASDRQLEGYVLSAVSTANADRELMRLRNGLLVGSAMGALAAAVLSQWMVGTSLKPIRDQIRRLVRFTSDASHELRHPLTAIRAVMGSVRERGYLQRAEPELAHKLALVDQATTAMANLVDDLLLLTRLDRTMPDHKHWRRFDLAELAEDLLALYEERARNLGVQLALDLQRPAWVTGDPDQLRRLMINLLVNAMQITPAGTSVRVAIHQQGHQLALVVDDEGPGIPPEQRQLVFERFWQADASRTGPNSGLGLSIARSIADVHGGSIEAQSASSGGCRMVVLLPSCP